MNRIIAKRMALKIFELEDEMKRKDDQIKQALLLHEIFVPFSFKLPTDLIKQIERYHQTFLPAYTKKDAWNFILFSAFRQEIIFSRLEYQIWLDRKKDTEIIKTQVQQQIVEQLTIIRKTKDIRKDFLMQYVIRQFLEKI